MAEDEVRGCGAKRPRWCAGARGEWPKHVDRNIGTLGDVVTWNDPVLPVFPSPITMKLCQVIWQRA